MELRDRSSAVLIQASRDRRSVSGQTKVPLPWLDNRCGTSGWLSPETKIVQAKDGHGWALLTEFKTDGSDPKQTAYEASSGGARHLGAAHVFGAGLPGDPAQFVVEGFGEVGAVEPQVDKAIQDAEMIVGVACIALLEPVDERGVREIRGDPCRKCAVTETATKYTVAKRLVRSPDMFVSVVPVDRRVVSSKGVHDVCIELIAFVRRLGGGAKAADGNGVVVSQDDGLLVARSYLLEKLRLVVSRPQSPFLIKLKDGRVIRGVETDDDPISVLKRKEAPRRLEPVEDGSADDGVEVRAPAGIHLVIGVERERSVYSLGPVGKKLTDLLSGGAGVVDVAEVNDVVGVERGNEFRDFDAGGIA